MSQFAKRQKLLQNKIQLLFAVELLITTEGLKRIQDSVKHGCNISHFRKCVLFTRETTCEPSFIYFFCSYLTYGANTTQRARMELLCVSARLLFDCVAMVFCCVVVLWLICQSAEQTKYIYCIGSVSRWYLSCHIHLHHVYASHLV